MRTQNLGGALNASLFMAPKRISSSYHGSRLQEIEIDARHRRRGISTTNRPPYHTTRHPTSMIMITTRPSRVKLLGERIKGVDQSPQEERRKQHRPKPHHQLPPLPFSGRLTAGSHFQGCGIRIPFKNVTQEERQTRLLPNPESLYSLSDFLRIRRTQDGRRT
jgi:hypothetical protein